MSEDKNEHGQPLNSIDKENMLAAPLERRRELFRTKKNILPTESDDSDDYDSPIIACWINYFGIPTPKPHSSEAEEQNPYHREKIDKQDELKNHSLQIESKESDSQDEIDGQLDGEKSPVFEYKDSELPVRPDLASQSQGSFSHSLTGLSVYSLWNGFGVRMSSSSLVDIEQDSASTLCTMRSSTSTIGGVSNGLPTAESTPYSTPKITPKHEEDGENIQSSEALEILSLPKFKRPPNIIIPPDTPRAFEITIFQSDPTNRPIKSEEKKFVFPKKMETGFTAKVALEKPIEKENKSNEVKSTNVVFSAQLTKNKSSCWTNFVRIFCCCGKGL